MSELKHYGTPRHSGRYPWGSGEDPFQSNSSFMGHVNALRKEGFSDTEIAKAMGIKTTQLRAKISNAVNEQRAADISFATALREKGVSVSEIARRMDRNESSVRSMLAPANKAKLEARQATVNALKDRVKDVQYVDIGLGTENLMGISNYQMKNAVAQLKEEGYETWYVTERQLGTGHETSYKVLAAPGTPWREVNENKHLIERVVRGSFSPSWMAVEAKS